MALTQVSSKGIKDATLLNEDVNASANIAGSKLADNSISLAKLEHGDSNNNGKFLRANNGADPSFETISTDLVADTSPQLGGDLLSNGNNINFADGDKAVFGTGNDLQIFHDGIQSVIKEVGGLLQVRCNEFNVRSSDNAEKMIKAYENGAVELYQDNSLKFATTSDGIKVIDKILIDGSSTDIEITSNQFKFNRDAATSYIDQYGTGAIALRTTPGGSQIERLHITSGGNVGIGVSNPTEKLAVDGNIILPDVGTVHFGVSDTSYVRGKDSSDGYIRLGTNGVDRLEINSSGYMRVPSGYIGNSLSDNFTFHGKIQPHYGFNLSASSGNPSGISGYYGIAFATSGQERMRIRQQGGITFNGDTAEANALNDFEKGTWTPVLSFSSGGSGSSVTSVVCNYTKIGNLVHIKGRFNLVPGSSNGGDLRISGLPFTIINPSSDGNSAGIQIYIEGAATNIANDICGLPLDNGTLFLIRKSGTTGSGQMGGLVDSGTTLLIGGCYQAA